jgi:hypothetical protein
MATWNGKPKTFRMETYRTGNFGYSDWEDVECGWEYNTTSDYFRHYAKLPGEEKQWGELLSKEGAIATLYGLMEWYNAYEGDEDLDKMIKEIRKDRE